jgi:hypothetical protein
MRFFLRCFFQGLVFGCAAVLGCAGLAQAQSSSSSASSSARHAAKSSAASPSGIEAGEITNGVYRNRSLALTVKIPPGWVLRTEEMNAREETRGNPGPESAPAAGGAAQAPAQNPPARASKPAAEEREARVLLGAFSRPPEARGEEVNGSIVIAVESIATYPGLTEAVQYFGPLTEVAKAQGFSVDEEPYEFALGNKNVVRGDFHKDVGSRVMRQSTLAFLSHGYAVSITVIGGTEDQVEELIDGVSFAGGK